MKHTPGPWKVHSKNPTQVLCEIEHKGYKYDSVLCEDVSPANGEYEHAVANARLIASAPDLLEALVDLLGDVPDIDRQQQCIRCGRSYTGYPDIQPGQNCPSNNCPGHAARAALAKAEA